MEEDHDTGPFCRHFSDPSDCEITCQACGHLCRNHGYGPEACGDCECPKWSEACRTCEGTGFTERGTFDPANPTVSLPCPKCRGTKQEVY